MLVVGEVYRLCREKNLPGVFRYLWKNWYRLKQWKLWALSNFESEIPKGRTTMLVEAHWKVLKGDYLYNFVAPRLDFLLFVIFELFIPSQISRRSHLLDGSITPHWKNIFTQQWKLLLVRGMGSTEHLTNLYSWTCSC
jgi:hypothetical protein